jgi:hypothetical protein
MSVEARGDVAPMGRCDTPGMPKLVIAGVVLLVLVFAFAWLVNGNPGCNPNPPPLS